MSKEESVRRFLTSNPGSRVKEIEKWVPNARQAVVRMLKRGEIKQTHFMHKRDKGYWLGKIDWTRCYPGKREDVDRWGDLAR